MVYTRRRPTRRMRRRTMRRRTVPRAPPRVRPQAMRTFTEMVQLAPLVINTGGVLKFRMLDVPQRVRYGNLYSQFCFRKVKVVLLPKYGPAEPNAALVGISAIDYQNGRLAFAVNDTPYRNPPGSEIDVLTDNGVKIVEGHKKITITCYPKPDVAMVDGASGAAVATRQRALQWFNFDNTELGASGEQVLHGGISWWLTNNSALGNLDAYDVFAYYTFAVRDPI